MPCGKKKQKKKGGLLDFFISFLIFLTMHMGYGLVSRYVYP